MTKLLSDREWVYKRCPYCGIRYPTIPGSYEPKACQGFECVRKHQEAQREKVK